MTIEEKKILKIFKQDVIKFLVIWVVPGLALAWFICSIVNGNTDFNLKEPQQKIEFALSTNVYTICWRID